MQGLAVGLTVMSGDDDVGPPTFPVHLHPAIQAGMLVGDSAHAWKRRVSAVVVSAVGGRGTGNVLEGVV